MIHPGAQFISIYRPVTLKKKVSAPKIQCWGRDEITAIDILVQNRRKVEGQKESQVLSNL